MEGGGKLDLLAFLRTVTLDVTNRLMFSVDIVDSADLIDAIIGYFKAWEYFLIRPSYSHLFSPLLYRKHLKAVMRLQRHSEEILRLKMEELDLMGEDNVADNFLKRLAV